MHQIVPTLRHTTLHCQTLIHSLKHIISCLHTLVISDQIETSFIREIGSYARILSLLRIVECGFDIEGVLVGCVD